MAKELQLTAENMIRELRGVERELKENLINR
jgi:hypothetical protein